MRMENLQTDKHYLMSGFHDETLKYWDADKFHFISELEGQRSEEWSISWSLDGEIVASGGHEKLVRVSRRTDEPLFLQEQDGRMDENFDLTLIKEDDNDAKKAYARQVTFGRHCY